MVKKRFTFYTMPSGTNLRLFSSNLHLVCSLVTYSSRLVHPPYGRYVKGSVKDEGRTQPNGPDNRRRAYDGRNLMASEVGSGIRPFIGISLTDRSDWNEMGKV